MPSIEEITKELKTVFDPEIGINIVDLGLVYLLEEKGEGKLYIKLTLTSPMCPLGPQIMEEIKQKMKNIGYETEIELTFSPAWGPDKMSEDGKMELGIV